MANRELARLWHHRSVDVNSECRFLKAVGEAVGLHEVLAAIDGQPPACTAGLGAKRRPSVA